MPTTVESSMAIPEPRTVAATTQRPRPLERARDVPTAPWPVGVALPVSPPPLTGACAARCKETDGARAEHGSIMVRGALSARPGGGPARHFKMLTARATTRMATTREMASSAIIMSFIQGFTAETSVGLKAVAVAKAKWK